MEIVPDLAESWTASDALTEWTFKLRAGARFHNGQPVTADDVAASLSAVLDKNTGSPGRRNLGPIESVSAASSDTVSITTSVGYGDLPSALAYSTAKIAPADIVRNDLERLSREAIGSGPFKLASYELDRLVLVEKNPDYFIPGLPHLDRVEALLAEAGYPDGIDLTMVASVKPDYRKTLAVTIREMAKAAGFRIKVETMAHATYLKQVWKKGDFYVGFYNMQPTEDALFKLHLTSDAAWNEMRWNNARFDELVEAARTTTDTGKRAELYADAQALMREELPILVPVFFGLLAAHRDYVQGYSLHQPDRPDRGLPLRVALPAAHRGRLPRGGAGGVASRRGSRHRLPPRRRGARRRAADLAGTDSVRER